jgi:hypothetical protein
VALRLIVQAVQVKVAANEVVLSESVYHPSDPSVVHDVVLIAE